MSIDLSLDRIRALLAHLPPFTRPTIHIVGTNGKGSVSAILASILRASSYTVGRFNSPHLVAVHDCISINDASISKDYYTSVRCEVERTKNLHDLKATNFELLTATALFAFEKEKVDVVVVEAGLGGRLDATNAIPDECILASALTAVDLDHQSFLGDSVAAIAREKAAVARSGRPFVIGHQPHDSARKAAEDIIATQAGLVFHAKPVLGSTRKIPVTDGQVVQIVMTAFPSVIDTTLPLLGSHQLDNLGTVISILNSLLLENPAPNQFAALRLRRNITSQTVSEGVRKTRWPGRLSYHTINLITDSEGLSQELTVLVDGAHNAASAATLGRYVTDVLRTGTPSSLRFSITYIIALSHSPPKTPLQTLSPILPPDASRNIDLDVGVALVRFTPPEGMPWVKSTPPSELRAVVEHLAPDASLWVESDEEESSYVQLRNALCWAAKRHSEGNGLIVLGGSLYLVADFYRLIEKEAK